MKIKIIFFTVSLIIYISLLLTVGYFYSSESRYFKLYVPEEISIPPQKESYVDIKIQNKTNELISSQNNYYLSYHIGDSLGNLIKHDNARTEINDLFPRNEKVFSMLIEPMQEGKYVIEVDIVKENEFWFKDKRNKIGRFSLIVGE